VNEFDLRILYYFNSFANHSVNLDKMFWFFTRNPLVTGGFSFTLFWYAWFRNKHAEDQEFLFCGLVATLISLVAARILALSLPFRLRPMHNPALHFQLPYGVDPSGLIGWSSFPSDHATVFFCLAAVFWFVSRPLGLLAMCHAIFIIAIPTIYTGIHYPTDAIAGALLGIAGANLCKIASFRKSVTRPAFYWMGKDPGLFYAFLFLCTFEIAELFQSIRSIVLHGMQILKLY